MQLQRSTEEKTTMKVGLITLVSAFLLALPLAAMAGNNECDLDPTDTDSDGVCDLIDNCVTTPNASPFDCDTDMDGYGNACDGDFDNGGIPRVNSGDFATFLADFGTGTDSGVGTDMNCGGIPAVSPTDFSIFLTQFSAGAPGPSGLACAGTVPCP
jgi:hypothetical protein